MGTPNGADGPIVGAVPHLARGPVFGSLAGLLGHSLAFSDSRYEATRRVASISGIDGSARSSRAPASLGHCMADAYRAPKTRLA
jgi:hypothetical protein